jgi:hypothetical protein
MPAIPQVTKTGPRTYVPAVGQLILGGQCVEGTAGSRIKVAAAGSTRFLGVAVTDARSPEDVNTSITTPTTVDGRLVVNAAPFPVNVAVAYAGTEVPVVYAAAANFGDLLICAANGQVTPAGATPDARTIIGRCTAPAGVGAGATGLMRIGF